MISSFPLSERLTRGRGRLYAIRSKALTTCEPSIEKAETIENHLWGVIGPQLVALLKYGVTSGALSSEKQTRHTCALFAGPNQDLRIAMEKSNRRCGS